MDSNSLKERLLLIAERSLSIRDACANEESTKLYLVLPVLEALGYDLTNPMEIHPEFAADFRSGRSERVDFAVLRDGRAVAAIECKAVGEELGPHRGQLRTYFAALPGVALGILTNGMTFEFFSDIEHSNIMDAEPFMMLELGSAVSTGLSGELLDGLLAVSSARIEGEQVRELAERHRLRGKLKSALLGEIRTPSEDFCRLLLQKVGVTHLRRSHIAGYYGPLVRETFERAIVVPVVEHLRAQDEATLLARQYPRVSQSQRGVTTEREIAVFNYVCKRLAFLVDSEREFAAIDQLNYRDYLGKFAVYLANVRKGRLFEFYEGRDGLDRFVFPEPIGEVVAKELSAIDQPLRSVFAMRVRALHEAVA